MSASPAEQRGMMQSGRGREYCGWFILRRDHQARMKFRRVLGVHTSDQLGAVALSREVQQYQRGNGLYAINSARQLQRFVVGKMTATIHDAIDEKWWTVRRALHRGVVVTFKKQNVRTGQKLFEPW